MRIHDDDPRACPLASLDDGGPAELVLLPMSRVSARYARNYLGDAMAGAMFEAPAHDRPRLLR